MELIETISEWPSIGTHRLTILTSNGEGKIQVDFLYHENTKFGCTAFIWDLYVHPDHRRKGIAKQLMTRALQRAKERGFSTATLEWSLHDSKREIAWWYASLGFDDKDFSSNYDLMVKSL